jgi:uncharacterized protein
MSIWWQDYNFSYMRTSHSLLLRLYHDPNYEFIKVSVDYIDRGAPGDRSTVYGDKIMQLDSRGMEIRSGFEAKHIPFHRVLKISYDEIPLWDRFDLPPKEESGADDI